jgi:hypothetical protein
VIVLAAEHATPATRPEAEESPGTGEPTAAHLVRLALDLQVDTLLFTVSAGPGAVCAGPDWRHRLREDLEALVDLAQLLVEAGAGLPAPLTGADGRRHQALEDLLARYGSLRDLLAEARRGRRSGLGEAGARLARHYDRRVDQVALALTGGCPDGAAARAAASAAGA